MRIRKRNIKPAVQAVSFFSPKGIFISPAFRQYIEGVQKIYLAEKC